MSDSSVIRTLRAICGEEAVLDPPPAHYLHDATEHEGLRGRATAVVLPPTEAALAETMRWCYEHDVPMVPRGGGSGFSGGCVPLGDEVVIGLERLDRVLALEPGLWRMHVAAGVRTAHVRRLARESGLFFGPDPGAAEDSQIGGNIATNAGGPHAFKHGVTGAWVTGLRAVLPQGEAIEVGGPLRKDVAGYDLKSLLIGSEGTLAVITAAWLRLLPAPEASAPIAAVYADAAAGCRALEGVLASGVVPAALEYLDGGALEAARGAFPEPLPEGAHFMVVAEADGSADAVAHELAELHEALAHEALAVHRPQGARAVARLWSWRDGVSYAVAAYRGGKVSDDIAVPFDRLEEAIGATVEIGARHGLQACSWGHAGDGNLHSTFMIDRASADDVARARAAAEELFALAARLGGTVSGEHGLGWTKRGQLARQWAPAALELHRAVKAAFDPKGLLNPGKKA